VRPWTSTVCGVTQWPMLAVMLLPKGLAVCAPSAASGPLPVACAAKTNPMKATIASRPFLISFVCSSFRLPLGFSKGNLKELQTKEIKNGRLAMVAFMGFVFAAQATGKGPLAALGAHTANPFGNNITANIGHCVTPQTVDVQGLTLHLTCLWPASHP